MGTANPASPVAPAAADLTAMLTAFTSAVKTTPNVSITTDIGAVANAITEFLKFAQTEQGQKVIEDWRNGIGKFNSDVAGAWEKFVGLFK